LPPVLLMGLQQAARQGGQFLALLRQRLLVVTERLLGLPIHCEIADRRPP
jgi:hypothetical protein